jgi:hypothetical protein
LPFRIEDRVCASVVEVRQGGTFTTKGGELVGERLIV